MDTENIYAGYGVIKRDGNVVPFDPSKITLAVKKAFADVFKGSEQSARMNDVANQVTTAVVDALMRDKSRTVFHIEDIQDRVELALMRGGHHELARGYVLYREQRAQSRQEVAAPLVFVIDGEEVSEALIVRKLADECADLSIDFKPIAERVMRELYVGATRVQMETAIELALRTFIETDPVFDRVCARLKMARLYREVFGEEVPPLERQNALTDRFAALIKVGVEAGRLDARMLQFDLKRLASVLDASRDMQFSFLGIDTLFDRYFITIEKRRIEVPQTFFMRVAMGLALNEVDREERAIEFYGLLSRFEFMNSTPTLFNAGTVRPQLASCYLTTIGDDLDAIYEGIKENALLQKYAGGLGNDWTSVRAMGAYIKGTNGQSQGVIPFLKVVNDTAVAVNQGGKRKGAVCTYLETWHLDVEEFLELRKNTGDDRRRTHDMNTANWIPDLFMKRVQEQAMWTLFTPETVPGLHDAYGAKFEAMYVAYEARALAGEIKPFKQIPAVELWRKMLSMLFETGHPWITFKDPCNIRSPQQHVGVVHSSNLCTEITLNTSEEEIAVCNIGSVNLVAHLRDGALDHEKLRNTVRVAMRMLDNVIDLNLYNVAKARRSNLRHRPVGIGKMGFQDALEELGVAYASNEAVELADRWTEALCYFAYEASSDLAAERGRYSSYKGSLWDRGVLPLDSLAMLQEERGGNLEVDRSATLDWDALRLKIQQQGMRNSNCVAIAPTATIGNIVGVSASIEPNFGNIAVKSNLGGEYTLVNARLVSKLKEAQAWDNVMVSDLKHFDGSVQNIDRVPEHIKRVFATAFEIEPKWLIEAAARRQKWIDQAQSLNIYMAGASGRKLDEAYKLAWLRGLKTTYYLRTRSASHAEKATGKAGQLNSVAAHAQQQVAAAEGSAAGAACTLRPGDPGFESCEACQ